jgi:hypothetical protein
VVFSQVNGSIVNVQPLREGESEEDLDMLLSSGRRRHGGSREGAGVDLMAVEAAWHRGGGGGGAGARRGPNYGRGGAGGVEVVREAPAVWRRSVKHRCGPGGSQGGSW